MNFELLEERQLLATDLALSLLGESGLGFDDDLPQASGSVANAPGINLGTLRSHYNLDGTGYGVALIDSGVDYRHPALGGKLGGPVVKGGYDFVDGRGGLFVEGDNTPGPDSDPMDATGHGTSIAGILASNDDIYEGVAPGVDLYSLRVLDANGQGKWSWVANALQWVIDHHKQYNIVAVNMSLGDGNLLQTPEARLNDIEPKLQQLYKEGVILVASSGNEYYSNNSTPGLQYPAVSNYVVSVGATYDGDHGNRTWPSGAKDFSTAADRITSFTQRSSSLDLLAPGAIITTTHLSDGGHERYLGYAGSSQAAPFVTGAAVLVHQALDLTGQSALATPDYIRNLLKSTGSPVKDGDDEHDNVSNTGLTFPRLNIPAAIQKVMANSSQGSSSSTIKPDKYEANNTMATATYFGTRYSLALDNMTWHTSTDTDWYAFHVAKEGDYRITVNVASGTAPKFVFHDVSVGRSRTLTATVKNGVATLDVHLRDGVRYFFQIDAPNRTGFYDFNMIQTASTPTPSTPTQPDVNKPQSNPLKLNPDKFENNNTEQEATFLGFVRTAQFERLNLHSATDVDWFRFLSLEEGGRRIEVQPINPTNADLRFTLINTDNGKVTQLKSRKEGNVAVLETEFNILNYLIKIENASGAPVEYDLRIGPIKDDLEPNGVQIDETFLGTVEAQSAKQFSVHTPGDVDWYRFRSVDDYYRIEVIPEERNVTPQMTFHDLTKNNNRIIDADIVSGAAIVEVKLRSGVNYFLEIAGGATDIFKYELRITRVGPPKQAGGLSDVDETDLLDIFFSELNV